MIENAVISPSVLRLSGRIPMPASSDAAGSGSFIGTPPTLSCFKCAVDAPITASAVSVRPEPTSPAKPNTSPSYSENALTGPSFSIWSAVTSMASGAPA